MKGKDSDSRMGIRTLRATRSAKYLLKGKEKHSERGRESQQRKERRKLMDLKKQMD